MEKNCVSKYHLHMQKLTESKQIKWGDFSVKGDLHCHTKMSDGSEGMEDVISSAKRLGLDFLSLTDHDTISSFNRSRILGQRYGVQVILGVELSCQDLKRGKRVHMLCYLPEKPDRLEGFCIQVCEKRKKAGKEMLNRLMKYFPITTDDVTRFSSSSTALYKQHIMHALMCHGYTTRIFGGLYHELFDPKEGQIYVPIEYDDVYKVIDLIHQAHGMAVLAHPYEYDSIDLLQELTAQKLLDGVEVYHSRCSTEGEEWLREFAKAHDLAMTGGSDFHGFYASKPSPLGNRYTPQEELNQLFAKKEKLLEIGGRD